MADTAIEPENPEAESADPVGDAAMKFTLLLPYIKKFGLNMGSKGLTRVVYAFTAFPVGEEKPRLLNEQEKVLFNLLQELQQYKNILMQAFLKEAIANEEALKKAQEGVTENVVGEEK